MPDVVYGPPDPFLSKRLAIADEAKKYKGAHYLWGAAGNVPGEENGASYRKGAATWNANDIENPLKTSVWAASCHVDGERVCCGRYRGVAGGRDDVLPSDWDLHHYLDLLKQQRQDHQSDLQWPTLNTFTPRYAKWVPFQGKDVITKLVWGEDCRGVRHFDCIHFVNYVLKACNIQMMGTGEKAGQFNIEYYFKFQIKEAGKGMPGDIVTRGKEHIGILDGAGNVIEAVDSVTGVKINEFKESSWDNAGAPTGSQILGLKARIPNHLL